MSENMERDKFRIEGAILGFDADGNLQSAAWIQPGMGQTEGVCRRECRKGGLAVKRVSVAAAQQIMSEQGWGGS
jgi:hypothetical protein